MIVFPSCEWFQELARLMNTNVDVFKKLGYADVVWAVEVQAETPEQPHRLFRIVFEEYGCTSVEELPPESKPDVAFIMQASYGTWKEMITNIQANQGPDLHHTLNYLALPDDPLYIAAPDFLSRDLFARYGQTYQVFFNGAAHIATKFLL